MPKIQNWPMNPTWFRTTLTLAAATALAGGCVVSRSSAPRVEKAVTSSTDFSRGDALQKIDAEELNQLTNAFADRYRTLMEDAVNEIITGNPDARQRALANRFLVESTTSAYDIATSNEPFSQVLDLTIMITLTSQVWIDNDRAAKEFGEARGQILIDALRQAREEAWVIASRVLLPDQLSALDFLIAGWRKDNPTVDDVYFVRFNDFNESRGQSFVAEAGAGGGLFEPIDRAVDQAKSYERLIERMFYLSKRAPMLVGWQSQAVMDDVLAKPEVGRTLGNLDSVTKSVDALSKTADRLATDIPELLARERQTLLEEIDRRQTAIDGTLVQVKAVVDSIAPITEQVQLIAGTGERMLDKVAELRGPVPPPDPDAPPAKPFDPADYQRLLAEASTALREANTLAAQGESLAASPAVKGLIDEVTKATQERIDSVEEASRRVIWQLGAVLAGVALLVFALAVVYREIGRRGMRGGA